MTLNYIISLAEKMGAEGMIKAFSKEEINEIRIECNRLLEDLYDFPPIYTVKDITMLSRVSEEALDAFK
jgi:hypothetical protein